MSKRSGPTKVKLADFKERKAEEGAIDVEAEDGQVFRIPPPELWPDEVGELARTGDLVALAVAVLGGEDRFEAFKAAGGTATLLNAIVGDVHGDSLGG